jgi:hypothetical protein
MGKSYFGVSVVKVGNMSCVPLQEIEQFPFYAFWLESARGSALLVHPETSEKLVYLHDWEAFSTLFIRTGKHRFMYDEA